MSRNQSLTKVVFVMPFIHIFKDPYKTSYQKSVILHFQTFSSNLLDFYIVSFLLNCDELVSAIEKNCSLYTFIHNQIYNSSINFIISILTQ